MKNWNNQLLKLGFLQATEALCHLCVTDIKKTFCNIWFFCKNEACANCTDWKATTVIWLLQASLEAEARSKAEVLRSKKKLEADIQELEAALDHISRVRKKENKRFHTAWIWIWMAKRQGASSDTFQACYLGTYSIPK